jgi:two-component system, OmpR family, response regulator
MTDGASTDGTANGSRLLLVEDDQPLAGLLSAHLRARGYTVTVAPTAEDAQAALTSGSRPDLLLLDINLPGETGWSLLRSDAFAAAGRPPVIVASAMAVNPSRLREFGVAGYLPKPFALDTLRSTIERLLAKETPEA